jgi:CheY-like chemotaxis protein
MRTLLADWGCRPVVAGDSAAAIAALEAGGLAPDAILADWRLAGPENGLQAIERLNARFGERPAAIVTGEINAAELKVPEQLSVSIMQKPVRARDISDWLLLWKSIE